MADLPHIGPPEPAEEIPQPASPPKNDDLPAAQQPYAPLIGYFEIEGLPTNEEREKMNQIWEYLGTLTKSEQISERLHALRSLENRIAPPRIGETRLGRLLFYAKADKIAQESLQRRDAMLR